MVLTRSQRVSRSSSKSDSDSRNSKHSKDVEKTDSKWKSPASTIPTPSNDEKPQPDSSTAPVAEHGRDAVAVVTTTTSDECGEKGQPKRKRSRKRNRKRKSTDEHDGQTEESTFSSPDDVVVKHQKTVMSEDAEEDSSLGDSKSAGPTASIVDEAQKENIFTATTGIEVECKLETERSSEAEKSKAEMIPAVNFKEVVHLYKQESFAEGQAAKPKGRPKSGRPWKTEQTMRFSGMKQDKPLRTSWQKKMQQKAEMKNLKMFEAELKETKSTELERKKKHRAKKIKRKLENQRKSEIVQVISNPAKMKRMKKKQLRKIEKRSMPDSSKKQVFKP